MGDADPEKWWIMKRDMPDKRVAWVYPIIYGARIGIGPRDNPAFDDVW
jgi:hypothetical protein